MLARPPKPVGMTLNLAPMVDVMMCLIIFFLLASKLVSAERFKDIILPWAVAAQPAEHSELGKRVVINVRSAKDPGAAEYVVADWDGQNIVERVLPPEQVSDYLTARAARAARDNETLRCVVRADREVLYRHVEVVIRACGVAHLANIVFSAQTGAEPEGHS